MTLVAQVMLSSGPVRVEDMTLAQAREAIQVLGHQLLLMREQQERSHVGVTTFRKDRDKARQESQERFVQTIADLQARFAGSS